MFALTSDPGRTMRLKRTRAYISDGNMFPGTSHANILRVARVLHARRRSAVVIRSIFAHPVDVFLCVLRFERRSSVSYGISSRESETAEAAHSLD